MQLPKPVLQPCVFQVVRVSGTIRKAEEEAVRRARLSIRQAQRDAGMSATSDSILKPVASILDDRLQTDIVDGIEDMDGDDDDEDAGD